jgi:uncharacterized protein YdhG (YjbR/CyaY superfamily)
MRGKKHTKISIDPYLVHRGMKHNKMSIDPSVVHRGMKHNKMSIDVCFFPLIYTHTQIKVQNNTFNSK